MAATEVNVTSFSNEGLVQIQEIVSATIKGVFGDSPKSTTNNALNEDVKAHKDVASVVKALVDSTSGLKMSNANAFDKLVKTISSANFKKTFTDLGNLSSSLDPKSMEGLYNLTAALKNLSQISLLGMIRLRMGMKGYIKTIKGFLTELENIQVDKDLFSADTDGKNKGTGIGYVITGLTDFLKWLSELDKKHRKVINKSFEFLKKEVLIELSSILRSFVILVNKDSKDGFKQVTDTLTDFLGTLSELGWKQRKKINNSLVFLSSIFSDKDEQGNPGKLVDLIDKVNKLPNLDKRKMENVLKLNPVIELIGNMGKAFNPITMNGATGKMYRAYLDFMAKGISAFVSKIQSMKMPTKAQVDNLNSLVKMISALSITVVALIAVLAVVMKHAGIGQTGAALIMVAGVVIGCAALVKWLNSKDLTPGKTKTAMAALGQITLLVGGVALLTVGVALLSKLITDWGQFGRAAAIIGFAVIIAGVCVHLTKVLSKMNAVNTKKSIAMLGQIALMVGAIALVGISIAVMSTMIGDINQLLSGAAMFGAAVVVTAIVGAALYGIGLLVKNPEFLGTIAAGAGVILLAVGLVVGVTFALTIICDNIMKWAEKANNLKPKDVIWPAVGKTLSTLGAIAVLTLGMAIAGAVVVLAAPAALVGSLILSVVVSSLKGIIDNTTKIIDSVNNVDAEKMKTAKEALTGETGVIAFLKTLMKEFNGIKAPLGIGRKLRKVRGLMKDIGMFIDLIQQFANLKYVEEFDKDGRPVKMRSFTAEDFTSAATAICGGFSTFISVIDTTFSTLDGHSSKAIKKLGKSLRPLIKDLKKFTDVILTYSKGIVTGYDENGKPKYRKWETTEFTDAAAAVCNGFKEFIKVLDDTFSDTGGDDVSLSKRQVKLSKKLGKSLRPLIKDLKNFTDVILTYSKGIVTGYDENGKPKYRKWEKDEFKNAAEAVSTGFSAFIEALDKHIGVGENSLSKRQIKLVKKLGDNLSPLFKSLKTFMDVVSTASIGKIATEFDENGNPTKYESFTSESGKTAAENISTVLSGFIEGIKPVLKNDFIVSVEQTANSIGSLSGGMEKLSKKLKGYEKHSKNVNDSIKKISSSGMNLSTLSKQINEALGEFTVSEKELDAGALDAVFAKYEDFSKKTKVYNQSLNEVKTTQNSAAASFDKLGKAIAKSKINSKVKEMAEAFDELAKKIELTVNKFGEFTEAGMRIYQDQETNIRQANESGSKNNVSKNTNSATASSSSAKTTSSYNDAKGEEKKIPMAQPYMYPQMDFNVPLIINITDGGEQLIMRGECKRQ